MSTKFFTNKETAVFDRFKTNIETLDEKFNLFRVVVGFFRSSGYFEVQKLMKPSVRKIQILIGINADTDTLTAQKTAFANEYKNDIQTSSHSAQTHAGMRQFVEDIRSGRLELRMHKTQKIHAKFYLMLPDDFETNTDCISRVIMGSSNLSRTALGLNKNEKPQYELNVVLKDYDDVHFCNEEFKQLWAESVDLKETILAVAPQTWLEPRTPEEIYYKMLIHHFESLIEDHTKFNLPEGMMTLKYQEFAAKEIYNKLIKHNGCFLGDVVGLGKTVIAAMVAQRFILENGAGTKILLVVPPAVKIQWDDTLINFNIRNNFYIITNGSLDHVGQENYPTAEYYDMVIVDESHGFRNKNAKYDSLYEICHTPRAIRGNVGGEKKKILLLSATIFNNRPDDIENQLLLFQDSRNNTLEGIIDINKKFEKWKKQYENYKDSNDNKEIDKLLQKIRHKVLSQVCVRRTRNNILNDKVFCEDLKKQNLTFPKVEQPKELEYKMDNNYKSCFYEALALLTEEEEKNGIFYARYRAIEFLVDEKKKNFPNADQTSKNLTGIYKTLMVKRLESSISAFKQSLKNLINSTQRMIEMFDNDNILIIKDLNINQLQDKGLEIDEILIKAEEKGLNTNDLIYSKSDFKPEFYEMLISDLEKLQDLNKRWDKLTNDPKLELFVEKIQNEMLDEQLNPSKKLVIFSESSDTVDYLEKELKTRLNRTDIINVTSKNRKKNEKEIRANFDANYQEQRNDYNIIIATEVLAEGINLHRANVIVNYDTPWNASRLIQRIGRVNRVGSKAKSIVNYVFYPTKETEEQINLYKTALTKLQAFHSVLGEDMQIFSREELIHNFELYSNDIDDDDTDREAEFRNELLELYKNNPERYEEIKNKVPDRAFTFCNPIAPQIKKSTIALLKNSTKSEFFQIEENGAKSIKFIQAAEIMRQHKDCELEKLDMNLRENHILAANALFVNPEPKKSNLQQTLFTYETENELSENEHRLLHFLRNHTRNDSSLEKICDNLSETVKNGSNRNLEYELKKLVKNKKLSETEIVKKLRELNEKFKKSTSQEKNERTEKTNENPDILLSETFI